MPPDRFFIVAVDGGAASGKSSTSRALSARFHLLHVDTGSYYRSITHRLLKLGVDPSDETAIGKTLAGIKLATKVSGRSAELVIDGKVPGNEIRSPEVNENVSAFAALPVVRTFLLQYQRSQATTAREAGFAGLVMEGRDIGSVIFPDAAFRFFLQADPETRARRRADQGQADSIHKRDRIDSQRKSSPLVCPQGAVLIDSTHLSLDQVVEKISGIIERGLQDSERMSG
jgi:cytidylate kinase